MTRMVETVLQSLLYVTFLLFKEIEKNTGRDCKQNIFHLRKIQNKDVLSV